MKDSVIQFILFLSLTVSVFLQRGKLDDHDKDIDRIEKSLSRLKALLPPSSSVSFKTITKDPDFEFQSLLVFARHTLAPRFIDPIQQHDTTLIINYKTDSSFNGFINSKKTIAQFTDDKYSYTLTSKQK